MDHVPESHTRVGAHSSFDDPRASGGIVAGLGHGSSPHGSHADGAHSRLHRSSMDASDGGTAGFPMEGGTAAPAAKAEGSPPAASGGIIATIGSYLGLGGGEEAADDGADDDRGGEERERQGAPGGTGGLGSASGGLGTASGGAPSGAPAGTTASAAGGSAAGGAMGGGLAAGGSAGRHASTAPGDVAGPSAAPGATQHGDKDYEWLADLLGAPEDFQATCISAAMSPSVQPVLHHAESVIRACELRCATCYFSHARSQGVVACNPGLEERPVQLAYM